jgi:hypothetical protein
MVWLGAQPSRGRLVAAFTHSLSGVNRSGGPRSQAITRTHVASRALARHGHIGVKCTRVPTGITSAVAGIAVIDDHAGQRGIGNVIRRPTVGRWKRTRVASGALARYRHLAMVPLSGPPSAGTVATCAIYRGGNVRARLTCGSVTVMASRTIGSRCKQSMVRLRAGPGARRLVTTLTNSLPRMNCGRGSGCQAIS